MKSQDCMRQHPQPVRHSGRPEGIAKGGAVCKDESRPQCEADIRANRSDNWEVKGLQGSEKYEQSKPDRRHVFPAEEQGTNDSRKRAISC
jgi:hypothetical protein